MHGLVHEVTWAVGLLLQYPEDVSCLKRRPDSSADRPHRLTRNDLCRNAEPTTNVQKHANELPRGLHIMNLRRRPDWHVNNEMRDAGRHLLRHDGNDHLVVWLVSRSKIQAAAPDQARPGLPHDLTDGLS